MVANTWVAVLNWPLEFHGHQLCAFFGTREPPDDTRGCCSVAFSVVHNSCSPHGLQSRGCPSLFLELVFKFISIESVDTI